MYPRSFDYSSPKSLGEVLELLGAPGVKVLAGGQSLIPSLKLRTLSLRGLVDIAGVKELSFIRQNGQMLEIGAMVTIAAIESNRIVTSSAPILREAAEHIADPLVRNRGTVGGNLCHGDPSNDLPAVMLALNSSMIAMSRRGTRRIGADLFFGGASRTTLARDEVLTHVEIPIEGGSMGGAYRKVRKGSGGFTIAGVASCLSVADEGTVDRCRIAMTAVGPNALRAEYAEGALLGNVPMDQVLGNVAMLSVEASHPSSDVNASSGYRRSVLHTLVKESVRAAYDRATVRG
ncbi:MAG: FAD binding domain-containing protein [Halobacteriota archaeon]